MPLNTQVSTAIVNGQADYMARQLDDGYFYIMGGVQPASADVAITTQPIIAILRFDVVSAPAATNGEISFTIIQDIAMQDGTMTWYRCFKSDNTTVVMDGNIGLNDENLVFYNNVVLDGQQIQVNLVHTVGKN
jgi:hypothetical protein